MTDIFIARGDADIAVETVKKRRQAIQSPPEDGLGGVVEGTTSTSQRCKGAWRTAFLVGEVSDELKYL